MTHVLFVAGGMAIALLSGHMVQLALYARRKRHLKAAAERLGLCYFKEVIPEPEVRWPFLKSLGSADPRVDEFLEGRVTGCSAVLLSVRLAGPVPETRLVAALRREESDDSWLVLMYRERLSSRRLAEIWCDLKDASSH